MKGAKAIGDEELDRLTEQLAPPIAEERLRLPVDEHDPPLAVDDHHGVGGGLHQPPEPCASSTGRCAGARRATFLPLRHREHLPPRRRQEGTASAAGAANQRGGRRRATAPRRRWSRPSRFLLSSDQTSSIL